MSAELDQMLAIVRAHVPAASRVGAVEEAFGIEFSSTQMERADGVPSLLALLTEARGG
jgi:hypothetical protein